MSQDYGYITGFVRSLESGLLRSAQVEQMLDAATAADAYTVLADTDFADAVSDSPAVEDFEQAVEKSLLRTKKRLGSTVPNPVTLKGIWTWYDMYNIKTALKAALKGKTFEDIQEVLSPFGSIDQTKVRDFAFGEGAIREYDYLKDRVKDVYAKNQDVRFVDFLCDKALFTKLLAWADELGSDALTQFVKQWIDTVNAQTFLRTNSDVRAELGEEIFITGGNIYLNVFTGSDEEGKSRITKLLGEAGVRELDENSQFQALTMEVENLLTGFLRGAQYIDAGPEPVVAYWWARQKSSEIIRTILVGKLSGIDGEEIRKHVKEVY